MSNTKTMKGETNTASQPNIRNIDKEGKNTIMKNLNYWEEVSRLAKEILDNALARAHTEGAIAEALAELSDEITDRVHDYVEGSNWLIYTEKQVEIYLRSPNFPEDIDGNCETFSDLLDRGSYAALYADVLAELEELIESELNPK